LGGVTRWGECFFVACAAFSPLAAIVLSVSECHEIGSEQQLDQFVVFVHLCIKSSDFRLLGACGGTLGWAEEWFSPGGSSLVAQGFRPMLILYLYL